MGNAAALKHGGLEEVKRLAMMGNITSPAYGLVHCLDGLLSEYPDFSAQSAPDVLHQWVRRLQVVDLEEIKDPALRKAVEEWLAQRPGTSFDVFHRLLRILMLIVAPLAEARRRKDGSFVRALSKGIESLVPEGADDYRDTSRQKPVYPGLDAAVQAVEKAHQERRQPRLGDIVRALEDAGLSRKESTSSAKRYASMLRAAGVTFDRRPGRRVTVRRK